MSFNKDIASCILAYLGYYDYEDIFEELYPGSKLICEKMNMVKYEDRGNVWFTLFGKDHCSDGPAVIYNGHSYYYYNGKCISGNEYHFIYTMFK